jgi:short-subunit dehydrogenase
VRTYALDVNDGDAVREVFRTADADAGGLGRIVANAGLGKGREIGSGEPDANRETAQTNVLGALAQAEAAMEVFRERNAGHLVLVSSVSAVRGNRKAMATYGATKAFVANLGEGLQSELLQAKTPIDVTVILPGYIESEMTTRKEGDDGKVERPPLMVSTEKGVKSMLAAIEERRRKAYVPGWPWRVMGPLLRILPLKLVGKIN